MRIDAQTRVRDVAHGGPRAVALLDEWQIDFCCHGDDTFERACAAVGIDTGAAIERLRATGAESVPAWSERGIAELVDHVVGTCHRDTRDAIARGDRLLEVARLDRDGEVLRTAFDRVASHALEQMRLEEERHYAHARALARARDGAGPGPETRFDLRAQAKAILERHAAIHSDARGLRGLAEATLRGRSDCSELLAAIRALYVLLTWQMHLENNVLLPRALDLEPSRA
jgi:regulator of cell morphogenesis and NO signaling